MKTSQSTTLRQTSKLARILVVDAALLTAACLVPALSHLTALPLYHLNPMLLFLLGGMLLVQDRRNTLLLAVLLPLVSMLAVGMPTPLKALCMMAELATVVMLSSLVRSERFGAKFAGMMLAIMGGKVVYYLLKALLIAPAVLVTTSMLAQVAVALVAALAFAAISSRLIRRLED